MSQKKANSPALDEDAGQYRRTVLSNGAVVVTESYKLSRCVSCGVFVTSGTRDEPASVQGISHFIEHMVFKGTRHRSTFQIAKALEAVGGELNAYTTREFTCFYTNSLNEYLGLSLDVLLDLLLYAEFSEKEIKREREVIVREIDMVKEQIEESIFDEYFEQTFPTHPLGRSILGEEKTLREMTRRKLLDHYQNHYRGSRVVVSVAGQVDHDKIVELVERKLGRFGRAKKLKRKSPKIKGFRHFIQRQSEQVHVLIGLPAPSFRSTQRFDALLWSTLLGGGMTSRLYQSIREKKGLAYTVYSHLNTFTDSGLLTVYAGVSPRHVKKAIKLIEGELEDLSSKGVTERELNLFKRQLKGNIVMASDDIESRMNSVAVNEMVFNEYRSVDGVLKAIDEVDTDSMRALFRDYISQSKMGLLLIGPMSQQDGERELKHFLN